MAKDTDRNESEAEIGQAQAKRAQGVRSRRNLLFVVTLVTIIVVFVGAVPLSSLLEEAPLLFTGYWSFTFILVILILSLAFDDLMRVRREHGNRVRDLEKELADTAREARKLAMQLRAERERAEENAPEDDEHKHE